MARFLEEAARSGQLRLPLPMDKIENNDTATFLRTPSWDYLCKTGVDLSQYRYIIIYTLKNPLATHGSGPRGSLS
jgi:hypothetical protein